MDGPKSLEVTIVLPVATSALAVQWKPRWAVAAAVVGLPVALMGFVTGSLNLAVAAGSAGFLGLGVLVVLFLVAVGPPVAGGYLLLRFLQRSSKVAFAWGVPLVVTSAFVSAMTSGVWLSPPV